MGFEINPDELASSYGGKTAPSKPVAARVVPADQKEKNQGTLTTLEKQLAETLAKIESDTAKAASTKDLDFRKELTDRIERAKEDIPELKREIARAGGTPAPADAASAPAASTPASGTAPGFAIDPKLLQDSYPGGDKTEPSLSNAQIAAGTGVVAGAIYGARKPLVTADKSLAARLMEKQHGLPAGSLAAFEGALTPSMPTPTEASLIAARTITPPPPALNLASASGAAPIAENPLSAMEKWAASQVGKESVLPSNVIGQATSNYANDPSGAPQIIQREAANTRLARQLVPPSSMQTSAGGIPYVVGTGGGPRPQAPSVLKRPRAIGPAPWNIDVQPSPLGSMGGVSPGTAPAPAAPAAPAAPVEPAPQRQPTVEEIAAKIRAASARAHALQRGSNIAVRGLFGAPLAAQAYGMATQDEPIDWQQWLSLGGGALGTFGPLTSKIPGIASRLPVAGPLGALAQVPYAYQEFMKENPTGDVDLGKYLPPSMRTKTRP